MPFGLDYVIINIITMLKIYLNVIQNFSYYLSLSYSNRIQNETFLRYNFILYPYVYTYVQYSIEHTFKTNVLTDITRFRDNTS